MQNQHMIQERIYSDGSSSIHAKKEEHKIEYYFDQADRHPEITSPVFEYARQRKLQRVDILMRGLSKSEANFAKKVIEADRRFQKRKILGDE
jgi:hypothetical protein